MAAEQSFESFMQSERDRLHMKRGELVKKQSELEQQIVSIDAELRAIDAYDAVKSGKPLPAGVTGTRARKAGGTRRSGIRDTVYNMVKADGKGMTRAEVLARAGIAQSDTSGAQSVSNALAALKRAGRLKQDAEGRYKAA